MMLAGARQGKLSGLRRLSARAMARDLRAMVVPGPEVARAHGLDPEVAGMRIVVTPRDANVLLLVGELPPRLGEAAAVIYAQMVRPRAILALGAQVPSPLPTADVAAELSQPALATAVAQLRKAFAEGAFAEAVTEFDAPVLHATIQYVCPMHPEVVEDEPGNCPKCGMELVAREAGGEAGAHDHQHGHGDSAHEHREHGKPRHAGHDHHDAHQGHGHHGRHDADPADHEHADHDHGGAQHHHDPHEAHGHGHGGHDHATHGDSAHGHHEHGEHHEAHQDHGHSGHDDADHHRDEHQHSGHDHSGHAHSGHDHGDMDFMSMIEVTKDLPRSADGLPMDWIEVPFGPFFPGLPGGLRLMLTLDGDGVAKGKAESLAGMAAAGPDTETGAAAFVEQLAAATPVTPVAYRLLACRAIERAAGQDEHAATARARIGALERERIASHLCWLAQLGQQIGFDWLRRHAASLQRDTLRTDHNRLVALRPTFQALARRLERTPLLKARLTDIGRLASTAGLRGPVARATGCREDVRLADAEYEDLSFQLCTAESADARARLQVRLAEILASLDLVEAAGTAEFPILRDSGNASGIGEAAVETPRGRAELRLTLDRGRVVSVELETPCSHHIGLVARLVEQQELGDALVAVGSLDLSPWEVVS